MATADLDFNFEAAYNNAPKEIKKLLNAYGDKQNYKKAKALKKRFLKRKYDLDYDLDGCIFWIGPASTK